MAYPPRYPKNPNRVTLDLDPITSDALTQAAKRRKTTRERLAYELVQYGLGIGVSLPPTDSTLPEPEDRMAELANRITSPKPQGRA